MNTLQIKPTTVATLNRGQVDERTGGSTTQAWHIQAVHLPNGDKVEDWWLHHGRLTQQPLLGAPTLPGGFLLPGGLVDAHLHLTLDFADLGLSQGSPALIEANWQRQQRSGVLAARDTGVPPNVWLEESVFAGQVQTCGRLLAPPGRYFTHVATWTTADELIPRALAEVEAGASWVKVIGDFVGADGNWFAAPATYPMPLIRTLIREVHAAGARVVVHTTSPAADELVQAGVDSIEHGPSLSADSVRRMADQGVAWTPTIWAMMKHVGPALGLPGVGDYIQHKLHQMQENLALATALGVPLLFGTDEVPHGQPHLEALALQAFGLAPKQILYAGSTTARQFLRLPVCLETPASFVLYGEDPRQQLQTLAQPTAVVVNGQLLV